MSEHLKKTELLLIARDVEEQCKGMNAEAPMARPCKLTYAGSTGSGVKTAKATEDSLKELICTDIDMAKTLRLRQEIAINNRSGERTVNMALAICEETKTMVGVKQCCERRADIIAVSTKIRVC